MKKHQQAFTLIELLVAVTIASILLAVGVPQYLQYVARSQAAEGMSLAQGLQDEIQDAYSRDHRHVWRRLWRGDQRATTRFVCLHERRERSVLLLRGRGNSREPDASGRTNCHDIDPDECASARLPIVKTGEAARRSPGGNFQGERR
jgi:prepilin-type N-terminal cleavage/methylation domain-containing protein